jgi:2-polyprenyl-3-methyl-5-hydroxy-6-metoxy-1,4-benzoquinol methylase
MRVRLREKHGDEAAFYAERYPSGYDHTRWPDHVERVNETVRFAVRHLQGTTGARVADLSCGDGELTTRIHRALGAASPVILGDVNSRGITAAGPERPDACIPLPQALAHLEPVDLYVCSETLEHLDDPDGFLTALRPLTRNLLVTTPEGETGTGNPEHYWGWDSEAVGTMLAAAGFLDVVGHQVFTPLYDLHGAYRYQMWMVK